VTECYWGCDARHGAFFAAEEQAVLVFEMELFDAATFERPAFYRFYYAALGEKLEQHSWRGD
jgi:hypothetical protein